MTTTSKPRRKTPQRDAEQWDHAARCASYLIALRRRDDQRSNSPTTVDGRRVRFRVRRCPVCFGWYVMRELRKAGT